MLYLHNCEPVAALAERFINERTDRELPIKMIPAIRQEVAALLWHDLPDDVDSLMLYDDASDTATVLVNTKLRGISGRFRFTLAHELGHILMLRNGMKCTEELCDEFAGALLMPEREFLRQRGVPIDKSIAKFGVSKTAIWRRAARIAEIQWERDIHAKIDNVIKYGDDLTRMLQAAVDGEYWY